jgi:hypothetical protein
MLPFFLFNLFLFVCPIRFIFARGGHDVLDFNDATRSAQVLTPLISRFGP